MVFCCMCFHNGIAKITSPYGNLFFVGCIEYYYYYFVDFKLGFFRFDIFTYCTIYGEPFGVHSITPHKYICIYTLNTIYKRQKKNNTRNETTEYEGQYYFYYIFDDIFNTHKDTPCSPFILRLPRFCSFLVFLTFISVYFLVFLFSSV